MHDLLYLNLNTNVEVAELAFSMSKTNHCLIYIVLNNVQYNELYFVLCILMYTILDSLYRRVLR